MIYCPLMSHQKPSWGETKCKRNACGWYVENKRKCAIVVLAEKSKKEE